MPAGTYRERMMWQSAQGALDAFGTPLKSSFTNQQILWCRIERGYRPDDVQLYGSDMQQATATFWVFCRPIEGISVEDRFVHQDNGRIFEIQSVDSMVSRDREMRILVREIQQ